MNKIMTKHIILPFALSIFKRKEMTNAKVDILTHIFKV